MYSFQVMLRDCVVWLSRMWYGHLVPRYRKKVSGLLIPVSGSWVNAGVGEPHAALETDDLSSALQNHPGCDILAVGQPVLQRPGQLHQPQRRLAHLTKVSGVGPVDDRRSEL